VFTWFKSLLQGLQEPPQDRYELPDEDLDAVGTVVEVITPVLVENSTGRIRFRGSTWPAVSIADEIPAGQLARIVYRDNIAWVIEAYAGLQAPGEKDLH